MLSVNRSAVINFIEDIWNQNQFGEIDKYISGDFTDHSLPPHLPANKQGMIQWIKTTGQSFEHKTVIDDIVCEDDKVMLKISMRLKHIGVWRDMEPTGLEIAVTGYRYYRLLHGKITGHWALLDGHSIENQLRKTGQGCKVQQ